MALPGPTGLGQRLRRELEFVEWCGVLVEFRRRGDLQTVFFLPAEGGAEAVN